MREWNTPTVVRFGSFSDLTLDGKKAVGFDVANAFDETCNDRAPDYPANSAGCGAPEGGGGSGTLF